MKWPLVILFVILAYFIAPWFVFDMVGKMFGFEWGFVALIAWFVFLVDVTVVLAEK